MNRLGRYSILSAFARCVGPTAQPPAWRGIQDHVVSGACMATGLLALVFLFTGCATSAPKMALTLSATADREVYKIGEPLRMTVALENHTSQTIFLPSFDADCIQFMYGEKGLNARRRIEPVHSALIAPTPREVMPSGEASRSFVFTRMTGKEGEYVVCATVKGIVANGKIVPGVVFSDPISLRVTSEKVYDRDPVNGLLRKTQARQLAEEYCGEKAKATRVVLVPMRDSSLYTWVVMVSRQGNSGETRKEAVHVNPYTGKVSRVLRRKREANGLQQSRSTDTGEEVHEEKQERKTAVDAAREKTNAMP